MNLSLSLWVNLSLFLSQLMFHVWQLVSLANNTLTCYLFTIGRHKVLARQQLIVLVVVELDHQLTHHKMLLVLLLLLCPVVQGALDIHFQPACHARAQHHRVADDLLALCME